MSEQKGIKSRMKKARISSTLPVAQCLPLKSPPEISGDVGAKG